MKRIKSPADLEAIRKQILSSRDPKAPCVAVCSGTGCHAYASDRVSAAFAEELRKQGLADQVVLKRTGCHGFCEKGPIVVLYPDEICYLQVSPEDVPEIVSRSLREKKIIDRLLYTDPVTGIKATREHEIPFYRNQMRLIFGANSAIDPKSIEDYIALGGYSALAKVLFEMSPEQVISEVLKAGLRGRGGGGFPTGLKWQTARNASGDIKYVIVNADEGDPGAYMDRSLLEGNPHSVLEGLIIGAYAIGAHRGYVYVRQEYPLAVENLAVAINQAREYGFIGADILGSGFDFDVVVHRGGGAFVCGESTALMASLEGRSGEPRAKHIHTAVRGLWDNPSVLNNVETWANVPLIINKGAEWYASIGTQGSKGTKIFSLVGKVNNTGLVEVPMGITLRQIIYDIGGGIPKGRRFKAVQTGGPSGGCIPEEYIDTPVDFDELTRLGSMMGSGGMIVMDEDTCMVDVAKYFLNFLCDESCGKCLPCREGVKQMHRILSNISEGKGKPGDIELLEELSETIKETSLCALGGTAPNPVLTTIRYFREEYRAHIEDKRCPSWVCKALTSYQILPDRCKACMLCLKNCPVEAIRGGKKEVHVIDQARCTKCGTCFEVCPPRFAAVVKVSGGVVREPMREATTAAS